MLRVLTYDIHHAGANSIPAVAQLLRAYPLDALALVAPPPPAQTDALARSLGMHAVYAQQDAPPVAWLTHLPILGAESTDAVPGTCAMLRIEVGWQNQRVSLFAVRLRSGETSRDEQARAREVVALLSSLPRVMGEPHLLAGTFNALHPLDTVTGTRPLGILPRRAPAAARTERQAISLLLDAGYTDCFRAMHRGATREPGYTYPVPHARMRTDYHFASAQLARRLVACEVVSAPPADAASDHYPVLAEFV